MIPSVCFRISAQDLLDLTANDDTHDLVGVPIGEPKGAIGPRLVVGSFQTAEWHTRSTAHHT
jgi:hypothetical protein